MSRLLLVAALVLLALLLLGGVVGWLAYGADAPRDGEIRVAGLSADASVAWTDSGRVIVEATTPDDLATALGYAHAADHAWPMAWLRAVALGTASIWLGDSLRASDLHARRLGFDAVSREAYRALPPADRALVDAYARGVNRALAETGVALSAPFLVVGAEPEPWAPSDVLAVERLLAWVGTDAPGSDSTWLPAQRASAAVRRFVAADSAFRARLGLGGAAYGRVFAAPSSEGPVLVQHHVAGQTANDLLAPVTLRLGGRETRALTVPGTLLLPGGATDSGAWGQLLTSRTRIAPLTGEAPPTVHGRLVGRDGDEVLVAVRRDARSLVLGTPSARPDSLATAAPADSLAADSLVARPGGPDSTAVRQPVAWRLDWAGFGPVTDAPAQFRVAAGDALPPARLFAGTGLLRVTDGTRVLGAPRVAVAAGDTLALVSDDAGARTAAARLVRFAPFRPWPSTWADDAVDETAAGTKRALLAALGDRDALPPAVRDLYAYLASWDGTYAADAIGPTIFEAWLDAHESITGRPPDPADSLDQRLLPYTLRLARAEIRDRLGHDPQGWRWGSLQPGVHYPVLGGRSSAAARRYQLRDRGDGGHAGALRPGPTASLADSVRAGGAPPSVWSAWVPIRDGTLFVRPPRRLHVTEEPVERAEDRAGRTVSLRRGLAVPDRARLLLRPSP